MDVIPRLWPPTGGDFPLIVVSREKAEWGEKLRAFLISLGEPWCRSIVFATSGSSGGPPKGVLFFKEALEASARSVNDWIGASSGGDWCCPLPVWHMGGFMIHVRASLSGAQVHTFSSRWEPGAFTRFLGECGALWSSLVPTQVVDLVKAGCRAPETVRCIIVGGGALPPSIGEQARLLGWPVVQSYGMTEAASQIATARVNEPYLGTDIPVLPHWEVSMSEAGALRIKGAARFSGYVRMDGMGDFLLESFSSEDWWESLDIVSCEQGRITFLRRADRVVKILGELVDLDALECRFAGQVPGAVLCPVPDERKGVRLYACFIEESVLSEAVAAWNAAEPGLYRLEACLVPEIPRNSMGKLDRKTLEHIVLQEIM